MQDMFVCMVEVIPSKHGKQLIKTKRENNYVRGLVWAAFRDRPKIQEIRIYSWDGKRLIARYVRRPDGILWIANKKVSGRGYRTTREENQGFLEKPPVPTREEELTTAELLAQLLFQVGAD